MVQRSGLSFRFLFVFLITFTIAKGAEDFKPPPGFRNYSEGLIYENERGELFHRFSDGTLRPLKWDNGRLVLNFSSPNWKSTWVKKSWADKLYQPQMKPVVADARQPWTARGYKALENGLWAKDKALWYLHDGQMIPLRFKEGKISPVGGAILPHSIDTHRLAMDYYARLREKNPKAWEYVGTKLAEIAKNQPAVKANVLDKLEPPKKSSETDVAKTDTQDGAHEKDSPKSDRPAGEGKAPSKYQALQTQFEKSKSPDNFAKLKALIQEDGTLFQNMECFSGGAKEEITKPLRDSTDAADIRFLELSDDPNKSFGVTLGMLGNSLSGGGLPYNGLQATVRSEFVDGYGKNTTAVRNFLQKYQDDLTTSPDTAIENREGIPTLSPGYNPYGVFKFAVSGSDLLMCGNVDPNVMGLGLIIGGRTDLEVPICCKNTGKPIAKENDPKAGEELSKIEQGLSAAEGNTAHLDRQIDGENAGNVMATCRAKENPERIIHKLFQVRRAARPKDTFEIRSHRARYPSWPGETDGWTVLAKPEGKKLLEAKVTRGIDDPEDKDTNRDLKIEESFQIGSNVGETIYLQWHVKPTAPGSREVTWLCESKPEKEGN